MNKILFTILTAISLASVGFAQTDLKFEFDFAKFKYDSSSVFMEFYYDLNPENMRVTDSPSGKLLEAIVRIEMKDVKADTFFIKKSWKIQNVINENIGIDKNLVGVFGFIIPGGEYSLMVNAYDANNPDLKKTINENIVINPYPENKFAVSDIELSANIKKNDADPLSIFYKNSLEVIPNPSMVYSDKSPVLFYYSELYNLVLEDPASNFTLQKNIFNSLNKSVYKADKQINQGPKPIVEYGLINLSKLPTDTYNLEFSLIDNKTKRAHVSSKRFFLYNPKVTDMVQIQKLSGSFVGSEFAVMSKEECDLMFQHAKYIASHNEINQYKALDSLNAKREFLFRFWNNRDTDPSTPQNEFKNEYMKRLDYVNNNFSTRIKAGYLSDKGRVYLLYGEPDQKDYFPSEPNMKPYEIWFYSGIEGGVSFIFGDLTGFGSYELLHSTMRGEFKDENWARRITTL
jgi:GWxTD domain-containing protein